MTSILEFLIQTRMTKKGGAGLPPRWMRDDLMTEHMGPAMLAKLNRVHRAKRKRGTEI